MTKLKKNFKSSYKKNSQPNPKVDAKKASFYVNTVRYPEVDLKATPTIIVSNTLQAQIVELHNQFGNTEWSGFLLYSVEKGSYADPTNLVIKAQEIFPCDVGDATYTEYDSGDYVIDMDDSTDFLMKGWKLGHIHTHHSMACFFSGTDQSELHSNVGKYKDSFYLSLIVNKTHDVDKYCAKIAKLGVATKKVHKFKLAGKTLGVGKSVEVTAMEQMDCKIENELSEGFYKQIKEITPAPTVRSYSFPSYTASSSSWTQRDWEYFYDEYEDDSSYLAPKVEDGFNPTHYSETVDCFFTYWLGTNFSDHTNHQEDHFYDWDAISLVNQFTYASISNKTKYIADFEETFFTFYSENIGKVKDFSYTAEEVLEHCKSELVDLYNTTNLTLKNQETVNKLVEVMTRLEDRIQDLALEEAIKDKKIIIKDRTYY